MAIDSYDDVRGLGDAELHALLDRGRPEERVWAIWALALRSAANVDEIAQRSEPDPGVRRNLAVVLAGHGQLDLLVALARRDPAPEVRAAAMQLVARLAADGKLPFSIVTERAVDDAPEVKIAVLGTMFAGAPPWLVELGELMLGDRDADVRYEAFEALVRSDRPAPAIAWLEEAPEGEARIVLMKWSARGRTKQCADTLAGASRRLRRLLVESVRVASWSELASAIGDEPVLIRALARRDGGTFRQIPLAALIAATLREPSDTWIVMIGDRLARLESPEDVAPLLGDYRELVAQRMAMLDARMAELRGMGGEAASDEVAMLEEDRVAFEAALEHAARLVVH